MEKRIRKRPKRKLAVVNFFYLLGLVFILLSPLSCKDAKTTQNNLQDTKDKVLQLSPGYLKTIPGSAGVINYKDNSKGVFTGEIELKGLVKGSYLLTLNENSQFPFANELSGWRKWGSEQYLDFEQIYINDSGIYKGEIEVDLPPGKYTLKFFVKEVGGSYPSVLYNDFLKVKVQ